MKRRLHREEEEVVVVVEEEVDEEEEKDRDREEEEWASEKEELSCDRGRCERLVNCSSHCSAARRARTKHMKPTEK
jgi:hypothetical protein